MAIALDQVDSTTATEGSEVDTAAPEIKGQRRPRRLAAALIVLTVAMFAVLGGAAKLFTDVRASENAGERDRIVLDTGRRVAAELVSLNHTSAKENLDTIAANSTGSFRDQFDKVSGTFSSVLTQGQVESSGEVKEAGIVSVGDDRAVIIAAVTSTVKNSEVPEGQMRVYRMKMTLEKNGSDWLVSDVEFVA
ncbi:hypothetical protein BOX37_27660 [Nocardia mangyaensis]|jgi:Mce-associated membrane protein|uniref:Mammalian cell entry protein n=1 Tax=Nocardia mangyaensis TaxID=2213200 RepID=A0A1J0VYJ4_9NOCA|nr:hypothetical protein [Nocardia mangyaensis]APE37077.1 hypothetical protein BOX37_27660 [Nocardia mangyaensis]